MGNPETVESLLKPGKANAIRPEALEQYLDLERRDLFKKIELEHRNGAQILAQKQDGGGFYLAETEDELNEYLNLRKRTLMTEFEIILSIRNGQKTSLPKEIEEMIKTL